MILRSPENFRGGFGFVVVASLLDWSSLGPTRSIQLQMGHSPGFQFNFIFLS
jgi:hypothetical protein